MPSRWPARRVPSLPRSQRLALVCVTLGYILTFIGLGRQLGPAVGALSVCPVVAIAWLLGTRAALSAVLLVVPLNTLLLNLTGYHGWGIFFAEGGGPGSVALILSGGVVGRLHDLSVKLAAEVRERRRAEDTLRTSEARLSLQYSAISVLTAAHSVDEAMPLLLQTICERLGWAVGSLWIVDATADCLRCHHSWHGPEPAFAEFSNGSKQCTFARGIGLPGRVWATGEAAWIADVTVDTNFPRAPLAAKAGLHIAFCLPLETEGGLYGVIEFFGTSIAPPNLDLIQALRSLGVQIGQFIERRQAEQALRTSEQRFRMLIEEAPIAITITNADGNFETVNPAYCSLIGYTPDELLGHHFTIAFSEDRRGNIIGRYAERFAHQARSTGEYLTRTKDGRTLTILSASFMLNGLDGRLTRAAYTIDITERKRMEEAIRTSEARLRAVVMTAPVILFALDREGALTLLTGGSLERIGIRPEENLGRSFFTLLADRPESLARCRRVLAGATETGMLEFTGRHFEVHWQPLQSNTGTIDGAMALCVDVTERIQVQREIERARAAAEELALLRSDFVAAVSHELRTPLTTIIGYAELLDGRWHTLNEARKREQLGKIVVAANRQQRLVEDLLLLSRLDAAALAPECKAITLALIVRQAVQQVQESYPSQQIDLHGSSTGTAFADATRSLQLLVNLLDNAAKYSPEGCPIEICWGQEGAQAVVRVRDFGPGVPEQGREHLFTRFGRVPGSRIRAGRVGTGLGLYLGRQFAQAMGGDLDLEAAGPDGSTFRLRLPLVPEAAPPRVTSNTPSR